MDDMFGGNGMMLGIGFSEFRPPCMISYDASKIPSTFELLTLNMAKESKARELTDEQKNLFTVLYNFLAGEGACKKTASTLLAETGMVRTLA